MYSIKSPTAVSSIIIFYLLLINTLLSPPSSIADRLPAAEFALTSNPCSAFCCHRNVFSPAMQSFAAVGSNVVYSVSVSTLFSPTAAIVDCLPTESEPILNPFSASYCPLPMSLYEYVTTYTVYNTIKCLNIRSFGRNC
jgi:hypothetical protein